MTLTARIFSSGKIKAAIKKKINKWLVDNATRCNRAVALETDMQFNLKIMKRKIIILVLLTALLSCEEKEEKVDNIQFIEVVPGGCAVDDASQSTMKSATYIEPEDTVTYTISEGNLDLLVGFESGCCHKYNSTSTLKDDTICISINRDTTQSYECECICYYTYNFKYKDVSKSYNYKVKVNNYLSFKGTIKP